MDDFTIAQRVALYDRTKAVLFRARYQAEDIAEGITVLTRGPRVTARTISHVRSALLRGEPWAIEVSDRFFWWARQNVTGLARNPRMAGTAANTWTVGVHLARELARIRAVESGSRTPPSPERSGGEELRRFSRTPRRRAVRRRREAQ